MCSAEGDPGTQAQGVWSCWVDSQIPSFHEDTAEDPDILVTAPTSTLGLQVWVILRLGPWVGLSSLFGDTLEQTPALGPAPGTGPAGVTRSWLALSPGPPAWRAFPCALLGMVSTWGLVPGCPALLQP